MVFQGLSVNIHMAGSKRETYLLRRKESKPSQTSQDVLLLLVVLERSLCQDGGNEVRLVRRRRPNDLLGDLLPGGGLLAVALLGMREEANVDENLDEFGEAGVTQGTSDDGLRLGDVVTLLVSGGVSVGVRNQGESCASLSILNTPSITSIAIETPYPGRCGKAWQLP